MTNLQHSSIQIIIVECLKSGFNQQQQHCCYQEKVNSNSEILSNKSYRFKGCMNIFSMIILNYLDLILLYLINSKFCMVPEEIYRLDEWIFQALRIKSLDKLEMHLETIETPQSKQFALSNRDGSQYNNKNANDKKLNLERYFECGLQAKFIVLIAKFAFIFGFNVKKIPSLRALGAKQLEYIEDFPIEHILADTNRRQFTKFFMKTMDPLVMVTHANSLHGGHLTIIIEKSQTNAEKTQIKLINQQNYIHCILSNLCLEDNLTSISKLIDTKYKKVTSVLCLELTTSKKINGDLYNLVTARFQHVVYLLQSSKLQVQQSIPRTYYIGKLDQSKDIFVINQNQKILISNYQLNDLDLDAFSVIIEQYQKIDKLIMTPFYQQDSKISFNIFIQNQFCVSLYGALYNMIQCENIENQSVPEIHEKFVAILLQDKSKHILKKSKNQKNISERKLGHYPVKIHKGSKVCCVCELEKKKKSRFKCEKCSDIYSRDIALCIDHFKQYHQNIHKYIPKGVRRGAHHNQLQQFNQKLQSKINSVNEDDQIQQKIINQAEFIVNKLNYQFAEQDDVIEAFSHNLNEKVGMEQIPGKIQQVKQQVLYYPTFYPHFNQNQFPQFYNKQQQ